MDGHGKPDHPLTELGSGRKACGLTPGKYLLSRDVPEAITGYT